MDLQTLLDHTPMGRKEIEALAGQAAGGDGQARARLPEELLCIAVHTLRAAAAREKVAPEALLLREGGLPWLERTCRTYAARFEDPDFRTSCWNPFLSDISRQVRQALVRLQLDRHTPPIL